MLIPLLTVLGYAAAYTAFLVLMYHLLVALYPGRRE